MIVKILQKSATFKAIRYNTGKVERDHAELILVQNFGMLQGIENLRPQDYINYLEALSSRSSRIKYPQFHVAISTKGRSHSKEELSTIAQQWMEGMGYREQPYLLIYHKDTANNHIHIVSSRVGRDGKKIADRYEKLRAYQVLNQILGKDERHNLAKDLLKAWSYSFSTRAQFAMILEQQGYAINLANDVYEISKYGRMLDKIELTRVDACIAARQKDKDRMMQIRAIIMRYRSTYDPKLQFVNNKYSSLLANFLQEKMGIQVIFHGKDGKSPHGYTIIDHAEKSIYKGGEIMPLHEFITAKNAVNEQEPRKINKQDNVSRTLKHENNTDLSPLSVNSIAFEPDIVENDNAIIATLDIHIYDDVDDEAVHGRRRLGKQKMGSKKR